MHQNLMRIKRQTLIELISEEIQNKILIAEDRESKNLSFARRFIRSKGYDDDKANEILVTIRQDIPNVHVAKYKFILGVTRMYLGGQLNNGMTMRELDSTLKLIGSDAHVNEYDYDLNGLTVNDLIGIFKTTRQGELDIQKEKSNSRSLQANANYKIVPIDSFEEATRYGNYTSWCVTHDERMFNNYTSDGLGRFYFCLRNGFQREPQQVGEGAPLDSYGLSMIAISVNANGSLNTCTCRWNHDNGGNDSIMDVDEIEDLLGVNFFNTFKPYDREELKRRGMIGLEDLTQGAYIDLGLPSGTLWSSCNVGAKSPVEFGYFFQWGNPQPFTSASTEPCLGKNYDGYKYDTFDSVGGVKVPSVGQMQELEGETEHCWCNVEGVNGMLFTSKTNGNTLFIPASGYRVGTDVYNRGDDGSVWSSTLDSNNLSFAWYLDLISNNIFVNDSFRHCGLSVRGVK